MPATPYDVATVVYRVVNVEGCVVYRQNIYSVPWRYIGQALPVRVTETELIVYSPHIEEVARHRLAPRGQTGQRRVQRPIGPAPIRASTRGCCGNASASWGRRRARFLDGLLSGQRYGRDQAVKVLALQSSYAAGRLLAALERAVRFGAYSLGAVERILAAQAQPKSVLETLADEERRRLPSHLSDNPVSPRPAADYHRLVEEPTDHGSPPATRTDNRPPHRHEADGGPGRPA